MTSTNKPFTYEEYRDIYSKVPRVVCEILCMKYNKVLLTRRKTKAYNGMYHIPGTTMLMNETTTECVDRLAKEELGIKVNIKELSSIEEYFPDKEHNDISHAVSLVYVVEPVDEQINLNDEADMYGYFDKKTMPSNTVSFHKKLVSKLF